MSPLEKKVVVIGRLIAAVEEYFGVFGKPVPVKVLSGRFGRSLSRLGGFPEALEELRRDGTIQIVMRPSGAKHVYPAGVSIQLNGGEKKTG